MKKIVYSLFFFLLVTQICFGQWVQLGLEDKVVKDIAARNSNIFAVTLDTCDFPFPLELCRGKLYRSSDNGNNWTLIVDTSAVDIAIAPSGKVFMLKDNTLFSSSDNGGTWDTLNVLEQITPPGWQTPMLMNVSVNASGFVFCGLLGGGYLSAYTFIASSSDYGITWTTTTPWSEIKGGQLFDYKGESVISAGFFWGLDALRPLLYNSTYFYSSSDNGNSWIQIGQTLISVGRVLSLYLNGNILFGGGTEEWGEGLFISSDSCTTWTQVSSLNSESGLSIESGGTLVGTDSLGVFLFSDNGDSLGSRNDGLTNLNIHTLTIDNNDYVYAGTDDGVWRRPLSEITSVEEELIDEIPTKFLLSQNYPNPFNPSTRIKYQVSRNSLVSLVVYDILGNEIETLVNQEKPAGTYEVTWYAENLPSGVYFYQLKAGSVVETKKMILLK